MGRISTDDFDDEPLTVIPALEAPPMPSVLSSREDYLQYLLERLHWTVDAATADGSWTAVQRGLEKSEEFHARLVLIRAPDRRPFYELSAEERKAVLAVEMRGADPLLLEVAAEELARREGE